MPEQAFQPEWFSKPGDTLRTLLDKRHLSPLALAERMGRDATLVHGLLSGGVAIDDSLAGLLAECVGGSATFWRSRQHQFDQDLQRIAGAVPTSGCCSRKGARHGRAENGAGTIWPDLAEILSMMIVLVLPVGALLRAEKP